MTAVPPPPPYAGAPTPAPAGKGLAITSLILGISSVLLCLYWFIALPAGIVAVVLGVMARSRGVGGGLALTGIITGAIGAVLALIMAILAFSGDGILDSYCVDNPTNPYCESQ